MKQLFNEKHFLRIAWPLRRVEISSGLGVGAVSGRIVNAATNLGAVVLSLFLSRSLSVACGRMPRIRLRIRLASERANLSYFRNDAVIA